MPKRITNGLRSCYVAREGVSVDPLLQQHFDAWAAGNYVDLVDKQFLTEFGEGAKTKSAYWRSRYLTCDEFFREHLPLRGRFTIFSLNADLAVQYGEMPSTRPWFKVLWTEASIPILETALRQEKCLRFDQMPVPVTLGKCNWVVQGDAYLFGSDLWELTDSDEEVRVQLGEEELRLLFLEVIDKERVKFERSRRKFSKSASGKYADRREAILSGLKCSSEMARPWRCAGNEQETVSCSNIYNTERRAIAAVELTRFLWQCYNCNVSGEGTSPY